MLQSLIRRAGKFGSRTVQSNRSDAESNDSEAESPHWTTRPDGYLGYALEMTDSTDESAGATSRSASLKAELSEETGTEWSTMDEL